MTDVLDLWIDAELTIVPTTSAFSSGQVIGDTSTPGVVPAENGLLAVQLPINKLGAGLLHNVVVSDDEGKAVPGSLWIFKHKPTTLLVDRATFLLTSFDDASTKFGTVVTLPTYSQNGSLRVAEQLVNKKVSFSGLSKAYMYFPITAGVTFTASHHLYFRLTFLTQ